MKNKNDIQFYVFQSQIFIVIHVYSNESLSHMYVTYSYVNEHPFFLSSLLYGVFNEQRHCPL